MLAGLLAQHDRIAIAGGPRTGKTTLTNAVKTHHVVHTDDYMHLAWLDAPEAINDECRFHRRFVVEGVQVARCLRGGKESNRAPLEVDAVLWLDDSVAPMTTNQASMAKGIKTTFADWRSRNHGVIVVYPDQQI
jgi:hypothetical protein